MDKKITILLTLIMTFAFPLAAFAEGEAYNPPGAVGATIFFIALLSPLAVGLWLRSRGKQ